MLEMLLSEFTSGVGRVKRQVEMIEKISAEVWLEERGYFSCVVQSDKLGSIPETVQKETDSGCE